MTDKSDNKIKNLAKNTLIISVGSVGASVLKLVNVLLFSHFVSVEQVGDYDVVSTYVGLLAPLAILALNEAVFRWLLDDSKSKVASFTTALVLATGSVVLSSAACFCILFAIRYPYALELSVSVATTGGYIFSQFVTRGLRNNRIYALQGIVYSVTLLASNVILVVGLGMGASGLLWSVVVANIAAVVYSCVSQHLLGKYASTTGFDRSLVRPMLAYSIPIVPNNIAWWLVSASNRVIINHGLGSAANGIYAISNRFPSILNMVTTFFYQAWQEQAITEYTSEERDAYYSRIFNAYVRVIFGGVLVLLPASKLVVDLLMSADYADSSLYLGPLFLSSAFNALAAFYGTGYLSTRKTAGALVTTFIGAGVNVACSWVLMAYLGLYAAAFGSMLGNLAIWLSRVIQTRHYFAIRVDVGSMLLAIFLCVAMSLAVLRTSGFRLVALELLSTVVFLVLNRSLAGRVLEMVRSKFSKKG